MASCPYCKRDGIDNRGLIPHIRMSADDAHGPQGELPEDVQDRIDAENDADVMFVSFEDAEVDEPDEPDVPDRCPSCGADDVYVCDEDEPIEYEGRTIAVADEGDVICLSCWELIDVNMPDEME